MILVYKYSKTSERERQKNPNLKSSLINPEEYIKIIQKVKMDLRMSALYETLYLSGARPNEVCNMRIEDIINEKGKISLIVKDSKSLPREIPLTEKPSLLLRWLENHPNKDPPYAHSQLIYVFVEDPPQVARYDDSVVQPAEYCFCSWAW